MSPKKGAKQKKKKTAEKMLWRQIPGTFNYETVNFGKGSHYTCHAKRERTDEELGENLAAYLMLNPTRMLPGTKASFDFMESPVEAVAAMIKNPSREWLMDTAMVTAINKAGITSIMHGGVAQPAIPMERSSENPSAPPPGSCPQCHGKRWVCPDHPNLKWEEKVNNECPCWEPEMACPTCNPNNQIVLGPGDLCIGPGFCETCEDQRWLCKKHKKPWKLANIGCKCEPRIACRDCNPHGHLKLGELKVIRAPFN
jgi:hypothetical protein